MKMGLQVLYGILSILVLNSSLSTSQQDSIQSRAPYRYLIYRNQVSNPEIPESARRSVEILLDEKAFSKETLENLFKLITKRFPEPEWMIVYVYTSLEQISTPEEEDRLPPSGSKDISELYEYNRAVMFREGGNEFIRYSLNPPDPYLETVMLKGKKTNGSQDE